MCPPLLPTSPLIVYLVYLDCNLYPVSWVLSFILYLVSCTLYLVSRIIYLVSCFLCLGWDLCLVSCISYLVPYTTLPGGSPCSLLSCRSRVVSEDSKCITRCCHYSWHLSLVVKIQNSEAERMHWNIITGSPWLEYIVYQQMCIIM